MTTTPLLIQGDALQLPFANASVDLIVTSPPYWSLRSYSDGGEHYEGQIGSEPTWQQYLGNLVECTREMMRVLKSSGSIWVNLGDKYVADNRGSGVDVKRRRAKYAPTGPAGFVGRDLARQKSLMLLPHRYAISCVDDLGLIVRQDQVWEKANGLPESVTDRTRRSHEYLFHMVKHPRYYSAVDEIRTTHVKDWKPGRAGGHTYQAMKSPGGKDSNLATSSPNLSGALPGSVWSIASQPLNVPDHISHARCCNGRKGKGCEDGLDHYAAFPFALVRPIIQGWSPREVCTACGEGRRPVVRTQRLRGAEPVSGALYEVGKFATATARHHIEHTEREITASACLCSDTAAPVTPGVVVDPFGGTGATALVASMAGRLGISVDASWDYGDLIARWRVNDPKERARAAGLDPGAVARIPVVDPAQGSLLDLLGGVVS
jgi:DNA modification methylase